MDFEEINLKLYLDELGLNHENKTLNNRITIQKAVFIGQCAGIDMGFHYEWHIRGPYSRDLTPVYYRFNRHFNDGETEYEYCSLKEKVKERISEFKDIIKPPDDVKLETPQWLEFIASIMYLMNVFDGDENKVKSQLRKSNKSGYCKYYPKAINKINEINIFKEKYNFS